jgi:zinc/manganese transport system ATP-binding protein
MSAAAAHAASLTGVTLRRGARTILANVTLTLASSEFVGLLGANGAGKTTLLRALLGLVPPSAGHIQVLGAPPRSGRQAIGYMPQTRLRPATLAITGHDFVASALNGAAWGLPLHAAPDRAAIAHAIALVGATQIAARPIATLSGGERQRLLLAQALLNRPRLLLLDEPLASLDPTAQQDIVRLIRQLQQSLGLCVVFSAHELNPILPALDRVLYLANGAAAIGPADQIVTSAALTRLYGAPIEVVRAAGRVFVLPGSTAAEAALEPA